jgi:hypothetical protein
VFLPPIHLEHDLSAGMAPGFAQFKRFAGFRNGSTVSTFTLTVPNGVGTKYLR